MSKKLGRRVGCTDLATECTLFVTFIVTHFVLIKIHIVSFALLSMVMNACSDIHKREKWPF